MRQMRSSIFAITLILVIASFLFPLKAYAWHGNVSVEEGCNGWQVSVAIPNQEWEGNIYISINGGPEQQTNSVSGDWSGGNSVNYAVRIDWTNSDDVDWVENGTLQKPDGCDQEATNTPVPNYQLNLSHIECVDGQVEIHFVLLNVPDGITPGNLTYTYGTISPGAHTGNVWHYTDHLSDGYYDVQFASVEVDGTTVTLHNPGAYADQYNCSPEPTATPITPTLTSTPETPTATLTPVTHTPTNTPTTPVATVTATLTPEATSTTHPKTATPQPGPKTGGQGPVQSEQDSWQFLGVSLAGLAIALAVILGALKAATGGKIRF